MLRRRESAARRLEDSHWLGKLVRQLIVSRADWRQSLLLGAISEENSVCVTLFTSGLATQSIERGNLFTTR